MRSIENDVDVERTKSVFFNIGNKSGSPPWLDYRRIFPLLPFLRRFNWPYPNVFTDSNLCLMLFF